MTEENNIIEKEVTSKRIVYSKICQICEEEIKGFSKTNLEYNMKLHKEACEKELNKQLKILEDDNKK